MTTPMWIGLVVGLILITPRYLSGSNLGQVPKWMKPSPPTKTRRTGLLIVGSVVGLILLGYSLSGSRYQYLRRETGIISWLEKKFPDHPTKTQTSTEIWKGSKTIVAPIGEDWSEVVQLPTSFSACKKTVLEPTPYGQWQMEYFDTFGSVNSYFGGGKGDRSSGVNLPANAKLKFRSLEKVPLNILVQWR